MLRRLNESLPGLVLGIFLYGLLIQILLLFLPVDKVNCSIGLWYGVVIAAGTAINLASVIYDSVMLGDEKGAKARTIAKSLLRYAVICILFFALGLLKFGNLLTALLGLMGLKISAYAQPVMARIWQHFFGDTWLYPVNHEKELTMEEIEELERQEKEARKAAEMQPAEENAEAAEEARPTEETAEAAEEARPTEETVEAAEKARPTEETAEAAGENR